MDAMTELIWDQRLAGKGACPQARAKYAHDFWTKCQRILAIMPRNSFVFSVAHQIYNHPRKYPTTRQAEYINVILGDLARP